MNTDKQVKRVEYLKSTAVKDYINSNATVSELSEKYKCGIGTLSKILKSLNIEIRNRYHSINLSHDFNKIDSEESAYWFGFLYADGSVSYDKTSKKPSYRLELGLCEKDLHHIEKFKKFMGSDAKIAYREKTKSYRMIISSKNLCINLYNLNIMKNKTYINNVENIIKNVPDKYFRHFLRGYTDGDGSIFKKGIVSYTSYFQDTMHVLMNKLPFNVEYKTYIRDGRAPRICITKQKYFLKLLNYLYEDSTVCLDRKYERYIAVLNRNIQNN